MYFLISFQKLAGIIIEQDLWIKLNWGFFVNKTEPRDAIESRKFIIGNLYNIAYLIYIKVDNGKII